MIVIIINVIVIIVITTIIIVLHPLGDSKGVPRIRVSHVCWVEETLSNFTITRESENFCFQQRYTLSAYALGKGPRYYGSQMQTKDISSEKTGQKNK